MPWSRRRRSAPGCHEFVDAGYLERATSARFGKKVFCEPSDMALLSQFPYHGLPANHSTRLEGRVNDRQSGEDCTTVGRTQGGGAVQSRIGAIAGDISP